MDGDVRLRLRHVHPCGAGLRAQRGVYHGGALAFRHTAGNGVHVQTLVGHGPCGTARSHGPAHRLPPRVERVAHRAVPRHVGVCVA